jgi:hypothetical protein
MNAIDPNEIIDGCGGTTEVARLCEVTPGAVSQWRQPGKRIPPAQYRYLSVIRPEVFKAAARRQPAKEAA